MGGKGTFRGAVLVAEDNPVNLEVARAMLSSCGLYVVCAVTGREATMLFERRPPDIVFMDVQMPDLDGLQATVAIRELEAARGWSRAPIIALTANVENVDRERCLAAGMDDVLGKPFTREGLEHMLERYLGRIPVQEAGGAGAVTQALEGLRDLEATSPGLIRKIAGIFLESTPSLVEVMRNAEPEQREAAERAAHSLKSSAARMGVGEVSALAGLAEVAARNGAMEVVRNHGERIAQLLEPVYRELREHLESVRSGARRDASAGELSPSQRRPHG